LLITPCSSDLSRSLKELHLLARQEGWWDLPAVRSGEVYIIQHVYFSRPGPRVVDGLEILAQILHPRLFTGLIPPGAVLKLDFASTLERPAAEDLVHYFHPYP
jgi:iron complex transport system substrate-binding protein